MDSGGTAQLAALASSSGRPSTRVYLARHGETEENVQGLVQGQKHGRLTSRGRDQARLIAGALRNVHLASIYASDLARARDTAAIISEELELPIKTDRRLRERNLGVFEGHPRADFFADQQLSGEPYTLYRPDIGETIVDMAERVEPLLRELVRRNAGQSVLIIGHGGINIVILDIVLPVALKELFKAGQENACINVFDLTADLEGAAISINDCTHLELA